MIHLYCTLIGRLDLIDDERFRTGWLRTQHYEILEPIMTEAMKTKTTKEWLEALEEAGILCGAVNTIDQAATDPQILIRDMIVDVHHPTAGSFKVTNTPVKLSRTPAKLEEASPDLGQHTREVLKEFLGMSDKELLDLENGGVIE